MKKLNATSVVGDDIILVWDIDSKGGDTLIKHGEQVIWREPAIFEGYKRFREVAAIMNKKYRHRLQDLVPTRKSKLFLYGDAWSGEEVVEKVRKKLEYRRQRRPGVC